MITSQDRKILRELAKQVAAIAALPQMETRKKRWYAHNSLQSKRPMMFISPEGSWQELLPSAILSCESDFARHVEWTLRSRIYAFEHFQDDWVVEAEWVEQAIIAPEDWGVPVERHAAPEQRGSWKFEPVIRDDSQLKRLRFPELIYDDAQSRLNVAQMQDLFGDILDVKPAGVKYMSFHLMKEYTNWCGLEEMLTDFIDRPEFVHRVLRFLVDGHQYYLSQLVEANLLTLNNDNNYQSSGGNGYTHELPAEGFDPARVRPADMWASAESQELALVSPRMHVEFALQYEKELLAPFGLNGYGCCEDLSRKMDDVLTIPNIRRISISPFADLRRSAEIMQDRAIFSWKPHPSHLVGDFDPEKIRVYVREALQISQENGCVMEMILKDTHTCEYHPERFDIWTQVAREEIRAQGWED